MLGKKRNREKNKEIAAVSKYMKQQGADIGQDANQLNQ